MLFLPVHIAGHTNFQSGDLGSDLAHWKNNGGFPPQGGATDIRETSTIPVQWYMGIPPAGGDYANGGPGRYGNLHLQAP